MSNGNGHRWSKWWWADDRNDAALRMCCLAARGLWKEILSLMFEADGYLLVNGKQPSLRQLASLVGALEREIKPLMAELEEAGVFSRTDDGTIYSRRMVRDAAASEAGREHIAKRWNPDRPISPPIRGGIRDATRRPNGEANSHPTSTPISPPTPPSPEAEEEEEAEEKKVSIYNNPLSPKLRASAEPPKSDAELGEDGIEKPPHVADILKAREAWDRELADAGAEGKHVRAIASALAANNRPYGEVRSADAQLDALRRQPAAVGADAAMGLKWQPAEPVRDLEAQRSAVLADVTPEQLAKAQAAFAARAAPRSLPTLEAPRVSRT